MGFLASAVSCGEPDTCDATTCATGCCDAENKCVTNPSAQACGSLGRECVACGFGQVCTQGLCSSGTNGGGSGSTTGGGSGSTTGGGTGNNPTCTQLATAEATFFAGNSVCSYDFDGGSASISAADSAVTGCNVVMSNAACTTADRSKMTTYVSCLQAAPACSSGNEQAAVTSALACGQTLSTGISQACLNAITSPQGGGTGNTGGGTATTGGGTGITGGGTTTTGGGTATTGGGTGNTGGGTATTGGGSATTGGGSATTGGGSATTGGGTATTGGGTGNNCSSAASSQTTFFAGRSSCPSSSGTLNPIANFQSVCTSSCTADDQIALAAMGSCTVSQPCTTGNENAAYSQYQACASDFFFGLSSTCQNALIAASSTGGGTGTTGGGTGTTGGGTGSCTAITLGAFGQGFNGSGQYIYQGAFTPNIGTTTADITQLIFSSTSTGTTNFSTTASGNNISTCSRCMIVAEDFANNAFSKLYYATSGSLSISSSPANGLNPATLSNVTLVEVTLGSGGAVTPVSGGACLSLASASVTASAPPTVPSGWVCNAGWYGDGTCDCGCGVQDSDCASTNTVSQCLYCDNCRGTDTTSACSVFINASDTTQCL